MKQTGQTLRLLGVFFLRAFCIGYGLRIKIKR